MNALLTHSFATVYGPVVSWRYGRSLGIDPIGQISTCSFNCVYCQLGEIEVISRDRRLFLPTAQIMADLERFAPWEVDIITLSGSGEPTLALNLGEILSQIKTLTAKPTLVLTNATLLDDAQVRQELSLADRVSVKLDGISEDLVRRINRPDLSLQLAKIIEGIEAFKTEFRGELSLQTMLLAPWSEEVKRQYIALLKRLQPKEIQLNTPSRPKPLKRELEGRGNHTGEELPAYPVQILKCISPEILAALAQELTDQTQIPVRCAPGSSWSQN
jgi:wyosine [tRNA(Phe)-imidazoG37] synthetase (radical SAM superfamily)